MPGKDSAVVDEKDLVLEAFGKYLQTVWTTFVTAYTNARGNVAEEKQAEERFKVGVQHARHLRDRALTLLDELG